MRSTYGRSTLSVFGLAAILAVVGGVVVASSAASPTAQTLATGAPKFIVRYEASLEATWRNSTPVVLPDPHHTFRCGGGEESGALTSSLRPGPKKFVIRVGKELGGRWLSIDFSGHNGMDRGVVTSNRTAQGFLMRYSGRECKRFEIEQPGCGAHTLLTSVVPLASANGVGSGVNPIYRIAPEWPLEPETIGCSDGIRFPDGFRYGWESAQLRLRQLYRCGIRKPRGCRMTIGRDRTFVFNQTDRGTTYASTVHIKWSIMFQAAGRG